MDIKKNTMQSSIYIGIIAGTLDILLAILWYAVIQEKTTSLKILQSIASGIFGKEAFSGGFAMGLYGLIIHYFIAIFFAFAYHHLARVLPNLKKHPYSAGIAYGIVVWCVMNLLVLPAAFGSIATMTIKSVLTGLLIIILAVGLPVSYLTSKYNPKM